MKYLSLAQINESIEHLARVHPFFLFTFWVAKKFGLPVGQTALIPLDNINDQFLRSYYKLHPKSDWYFTPFRGANQKKVWLKPDYASSGLQAINTQTFRDVFEHPPGSSSWGWVTNYVAELKRLLRNRRVPLFDLAVWILRNTPFPDEYTRIDVLNKFITDYFLTSAEVHELFNESINSQVEEDEAFQDVPVEWNEIITPYPMPPDIGPESEAILTFISLQSLGPIVHLVCRPATRLNLLTGDNGVGKTFLLDTVWWALTNDWVEFPILPRPSNITDGEPSITYQFSGTVTHKPQTVRYDSKQGWRVADREVIQSLVLYSRSDGAFAIWDPVRYDNDQLESKIHLNRDQVWSGKDRLIEGLLRDLVTWASGKNQDINELFLRNLARLSPPEMSKLALGDPVELPGYSQQIPTLRHAYGDVPLLFESAGIRRMVAMVYLIVWAWMKHKKLAASLDRSAARKLVLLVDELEAHLHPKWQRTVLPALLGVLNDLSSELDSQVFVATHSPFVAASMEGDFRKESDKSFSLDLQKNGSVTFHELEYRPRGPVDAWLISPTFGLKDARSIDSAAAIRSAVALQDEIIPSEEEVKLAHERLVKLLPASDRFWPRWLLFAKQHGVEI